MDVFRHSDLVEVRRDSSKGLGGRGVFASRPIVEGTVIERVPVLLIPRNQVFDPSNEARRSCRLAWYVYEWCEGEEDEHVAVALGYGSLYNHSYHPNAFYRLESPDAIEFISLRRIEADEEITLNYNGEVDDRTPVELHPTH
jgi:SET domain-containing protein